MADQDDYQEEPLDIEHDTLIGQIIDRNTEDSERASSAGESRQAIGEYLEASGMNSQAFSWMRSIMKKKKYSQRMDIIRSLEEALPMVKAHVMGQGFGPDLVDRAEGKVDEAPADPVDYDDGDEEPADDYHDDAPATDDEMVDFNASVDDVTDEAGNVHPFGVGKRA